MGNQNFMGGPMMGRPNMMQQQQQQQQQQQPMGMLAGIKKAAGKAWDLFVTSGMRTHLLIGQLQLLAT